ncbi:MAG: TIGR01459 family HAD-type hydrolase [Bosea sp. (in: a-proteobacteria)]
MTKFISGLAELAPHYDVVFCDVWGVIHNGVAAFSAACTALETFRKAGGTVILVSNAPRPNPSVMPQLKNLGVPDTAWDAIVTSGDVARRLIADRAGEKLYFIGAARDHHLFAGLDAPHGSINEAGYIVCTGFADDETETVDDYHERLSALAERKLHMLCANPDLVVERGHRLIPCAGAIAERYATLGGDVTQTGKPFRPIYETALAKAAELRGQPVQTSRILAIGDAIRTDVAGAAGMGIDALFVMRGIHGVELLGDGMPSTEAFEQWSAEQTHQPSHAIEWLR